MITAEIDNTRFEDFAEKVKERAKQEPFNYEFEDTRKVGTTHKTQYYIYIYIQATSKIRMTFSTHKKWFS